MCNRKKTGIGKGKVMETRPWWKKKNSPNIIYVGLDAGRKTAYSKGKGSQNKGLVKKRMLYNEDWLLISDRLP